LTRYDLALIGFGGVNRALAELIDERRDQLVGELGIDLRIVAITDLRAGSLIAAEGIDLSAVLSTAPDQLQFAGMPGGSAEPRNEYVIAHGPGDVVVEATFTNPDDGEPAASHVRWALQAGKHVCTTNKGPVALHARELAELADQHGVSFEFEGSVMSGTPVLRTARQLLAGAGLRGFEGILNGTSNYILSQLESGAELEATIRQAQQLGYAEANPSADLEGYDVQLKVVILANQLLGANLTRDDVPCSGITALTPADIRAAASKGQRWKLIGQATLTPAGEVRASVLPVAVAASHPLSGVSGPMNAIALHTELLGTVTISGPGAGRVETAYALLSDIIALHRARRGDHIPGRESTAASSELSHA
jgi:homoserine dehydrogenase